jgi:hypothetical protein
LFKGIRRIFPAAVHCIMSALLGSVRKLSEESYIIQTLAA